MGVESRWTKQALNEIHSQHWKEPTKEAPQSC